MLGVCVGSENGIMQWSRNQAIPEVPKKLTRRSIFSWCGRVTSHLPVCGYVRPACSYIKRRATAVTSTWDEDINDDDVRSMVLDLKMRCVGNDPAKGRWEVTSDEATVWVDASSLALGVVLEVDGNIVEDACWLRQNQDAHINMAELDAVLKGVNLAVAWKITSINLMTDSSSVYHWLSDAVSGKARLKTKASGELLIRRRVSTFQSIVKEYDLTVSVHRVSSADNRADALTRVPNAWLRNNVQRQSPDQRLPISAACVNDDVLSKVARIHHDTGHPGVRRTWFFVRRANVAASRRQVAGVVSRCQVCTSINPAPVKWRTGKLNVDRPWQRLGIDITHFRGQHYLTVIDHGPSRYTLWRSLRLQDTASVKHHLETIFLERGAPEELILDNDTAFRSREFRLFASEWQIRLHFRCAYRPEGNGITERCHRSVKTIAARKSCSISEAVYWYNVAPLNATDAMSSPAGRIFSYSVRIRGVDQEKQPVSREGESGCRFNVGDRVWVRPPGVRCDEQYGRGVVTRVISENSVEVGGIPRHIRDLRPRLEDEECSSETSEEESEMIISLERDGSIGSDVEDETRLLRRSERVRRPPLRYCCD